MIFKNNIVIYNHTNTYAYIYSYIMYAYILICRVNEICQASKISRQTPKQYV